MKDKIFKILIVEDEFHCIDTLTEFIKKRTELHIEKIAYDGNEALNMIKQHNYDLIFLDVHIPIIDGIELLKKIKNRSSYIIFTTAYKKYAVKAFDYGAVDYLLKPIPEDRFNQAIDKFLNFKKIDNKKNSQQKLIFNIDEKQFVIDYKNIIFLTAAGKQVIIHTNTNDYEAPYILKETEKKLSSEIFIRIHKQYIINITYVIGFEYDNGSQYVVKLKDEDDTILPVGKNYVSILKERLNIH